MYTQKILLSIKFIKICGIPLSKPQLLHNCHGKNIRKQLKLDFATFCHLSLEKRLSFFLYYHLDAILQKFGLLVSCFQVRFHQRFCSFFDKDCKYLLLRIWLQGLMQECTKGRIKVCHNHFHLFCPCTRVRWVLEFLTWGTNISFILSKQQMGFKEISVFCKLTQRGAYKN